jgi:hypothetical protein
MEENYQGGAAPTADASPSIWSIMVGVFTAPTKAFEDYRQKPSIVIPLIVTVLLAVIVSVAVAKFNAMSQYDLMKTSTSLPAAALEEMRRAIENPSYLTAILGAAFGTIIIGLIEALVAWFFGSFVFGGQAKLMPVWGVVFLSGLIYQAGNLLRVPLVYAKGSMMVSYGLAALLPGKDFTSILYTILYFADFPMIWSVIVAGIGYSAVFGIKRGKGITMAAIIAVLFVTVMISLMVFGLGLAGVKFHFV